MKPIITYSLRNGERHSDAFYHTITDFSQQWLESAHTAVGADVAAFQAHRQETGQTPRSFAECAFELLVLGVMQREHGLQAKQTPAWTLSLLSRLVDFQGRHAWAEKQVKLVRGWMVHLAGILHTASPGPGAAGRREIPLLLNWMRALDYGGQVERLAEWQSYFETLDPQTADEALARCLKLADDFATQAEAILGAFTHGVEKFLRAEAPLHAWQYDAPFVSRRPLEYHLGMLGSELLSQAYRERFLETQRKVVILPPCMRARPEDECQAIPTPLGDLCQGCTPGCPIQVVTKLGEKRGFAVYMMPDELRKFKSGSPQGKNTFGVVGVSCALTNWPGGWDLDKEGIPGQGLLLDFVGCSYHWDKDGVSTELNLKKLAELIGNKKS